MVAMCKSPRISKWELIPGWVNITIVTTHFYRRNLENKPRIPGTWVEMHVAQNGQYRKAKVRLPLPLRIKKFKKSIKNI